MNSEVHIGKYLSDAFPTQNGVKQGDALLSLLFNFAVTYISREIQKCQEQLQLGGTKLLYVYAYTNLLSIIINAIK
jgi:hypothetical protein